MNTQTFIYIYRGRDTINLDNILHKKFVQFKIPRYFKGKFFTIINYT